MKSYQARPVFKHKGECYPVDEVPEKATFWSVYEAQPVHYPLYHSTATESLVIADFYGENAEANARHFAQTMNIKTALAS